MQTGFVKVSVRPTRFDGLGYANVGGDWRFVDIASDQVTGAIYRTRGELLADLATFAQVMGY